MSDWGQVLMTINVAACVPPDASSSRLSLTADARRCLPSDRVVFGPLGGCHLASCTAREQIGPSRQDQCQIGALDWIVFPAPLYVRQWGQLLDGVVVPPAQWPEDS